MSEIPNEAPASVESPAAKDPAVRIFILAAMLVAFGIWAMMDLSTGKFHYVDPGEDINAFGKWAFNAFGAYICTPVGVVIAVLGLRFLKGVLVADGEGIGWKGKTKRPWAQVATLDATQLRDKGILVVHFKDGARIKLDSWKLQNFKKLVAVVEANVPKTKE